ncbi:MAG TPA: DUF488 domain-containing protein [Trueperaceae bacterium]|nr:DUF488 domain-containing protein [Trueperaceae bacterium]
MPSTTIFTIGHSTRTLEELVGLLAAHGVRNLVDVRTIPKSQRHPHFAGEALAVSLPAAGISYHWMKALGGLRHPRPESPNDAWLNRSFRGYADHMQSAEFNEAVDDLVERGQGNDLAIMCSEAVPWRCHRSLIGDALLVRGVTVLDIMSTTKAPAHKLTSFARVEGTNITYPAAAED